jgi:hypothetical protein
MVAVQMADENMLHTVKIGLHSHELHLSSFSTVDQK